MYEDPRREKQAGQCQFRKCRNDIAYKVLLTSGNKLFYCNHHANEASLLKIVATLVSWEKK